jgi:alpha-L-fucosidase
LARIRAWGGNFLINMAPDSHGELPSVAYKRMDELAKWMELRRESIENVKAGPWPEKCNVPVTCSGSVWYLHLSWLWDSPVELNGIERPPKRVSVLGGDSPVEWTSIERGLKFFIPQNRISSLGEVVKVEWA